MASQSLRTLTLAYKELDGREDMETQDNHDVYDVETKGFILLGIMGIKDALRETVKESVKQCQDAGIKVRMVTGDNPKTSEAIAKECGILQNYDAPDYNMSEHVMLGK